MYPLIITTYYFNNNTYKDKLLFIGNTTLIQVSMSY